MSMKRDLHDRGGRRGARRRVVLLGAGVCGMLILTIGLVLLWEYSASPSRSSQNLAPERAIPVGLLASPTVVAVDQRGNVLSLDPANPVLDLPVLRVLTPRADALWGLRVLARDVDYMAETSPEVFAVISEARIDDREVSLLLGDSQVRVRYLPPISESRLRAGIIALNDALGRFEERSPREVDLRFADQVVVRTR